MPNSLETEVQRKIFMQVNFKEVISGERKREKEKERQGSRQTSYLRWSLLSVSIHREFYKNELLCVIDPTLRPKINFLSHESQSFGYRLPLKV